jgi:hypothetical protein
MSRPWWHVNDPRFADDSPSDVPFIGALPLDKMSATISMFVATGANMRWLAFNLTRIVRAVQEASK